MTSNVFHDFKCICFAQNLATWRGERNFEVYFPGKKAGGRHYYVLFHLSELEHDWFSRTPGDTTLRQSTRANIQRLDLGIQRLDVGIQSLFPSPKSPEDKPITPGRVAEKRSSKEQLSSPKEFCPRHERVPSVGKFSLLEKANQFIAEQKAGGHFRGYHWPTPLSCWLWDASTLSL